MTGHKQGHPALNGLPPENREGLRWREEPGDPGGADEIEGERDDSEPQGILATVGFS